MATTKKRRHLARDLVTLVRVQDRLDQAQTLLQDAYNILNDDRLKLPQLAIVQDRVKRALEETERAAEPFDAAFADEPCEETCLVEFAKEYEEMTSASYKGGRGEVD